MFFDILSICLYIYIYIYIYVIPIIIKSDLPNLPILHIYIYMYIYIFYYIHITRENKIECTMDYFKEDLIFIGHFWLDKYTFCLDIF